MQETTSSLRSEESHDHANRTMPLADESVNMPPAPYIHTETLGEPEDSHEISSHHDPSLSDYGAHSAADKAKLTATDGVPPDDGSGVDDQDQPSSKVAGAKQDHAQTMNASFNVANKTESLADEGSVQRLEKDEVCQQESRDNDDSSPANPAAGIWQAMNRSLNKVGDAAMEILHHIEGTEGANDTREDKIGKEIADPDPAASAQTSVPISEDAVAETSTARFLVLCSGMSLKRETLANQEMCYTIFDGLNLPYDKVDGAEPVNKERRNELFEISGIRGQYPLFFIMRDGATTYFGDWDTFQYANDEGTLPSALLSPGATSNLLSSAAAASPPGHKVESAASDHVPIPVPKTEAEHIGVDVEQVLKGVDVRDGSGPIRRLSKLPGNPNAYSSNGHGSSEQNERPLRRVSKLTLPKSFTSRNRQARLMNTIGHQSFPQLSIPSMSATGVEAPSEPDLKRAPRRPSKISIPPLFSKSDSVLSFEPDSLLPKLEQDSVAAYSGSGSRNLDSGTEPVSKTDLIPEIAVVSQSRRSTQPRRMSKKLFIPETFTSQGSHGSSIESELDIQDTHPDQPSSRRQSSKITIPSSFGGGRKEKSRSQNADGLDNNEGSSNGLSSHDSPRRPSSHEGSSIEVQKEADSGDNNADDFDGRSVEHDTPIPSAPRPNLKDLDIPSSLGGIKEPIEDSTAAAMLLHSSLNGRAGMNLDEPQHAMNSVSPWRESRKLVIPSSFGGKSNANTDSTSETSTSNGFGNQGDKVPAVNPGSPRLESRKLVIPSTFGGSATSDIGGTAVNTADAPSNLTSRRPSKKLVIPATFGGANDVSDAAIGHPPPANHAAPRCASKNLVIPGTFSQKDAESLASHQETKADLPLSKDLNENADILSQFGLGCAPEQEASLESTYTKASAHKPNKLAIPGPFCGNSSGEIGGVPYVSLSVSTPTKKRLTIPGAFGGGANSKAASSNLSLPMTPTIAAPKSKVTHASTSDEISSGGDKSISDKSATIEPSNAEPVKPAATASPGPRKKLVIPGAFAKSTEPPKKFSGGIGW